MWNCCSWQGFTWTLVLFSWKVFFFFQGVRAVLPQQTLLTAIPLWLCQSVLFAFSIPVSGCNPIKLGRWVKKNRLKVMGAFLSLREMVHPQTCASCYNENRVSVLLSAGHPGFGRAALDHTWGSACSVGVSSCWYLGNSFSRVFTFPAVREESLKKVSAEGSRPASWQLNNRWGNWS